MALAGAIALAAPHVAAAAPANDLFASAQLLTGTSGSVAGSNVGATSEPGEPNAGYGMGMGFTVWYRWTAPASGRFEIDLNGTNFLAIAGVYTGSTVSALSAITWTNDAGAYGYPRLTFDATAGVTYQIQVDGRGYPTPTGSIVLNWSPVPPPPNDAFVNATALTGVTGSTKGDTSGATAEPNEPPGGGRSVWYRWTAVYDGDYKFAVAGWPFNCSVGVYTGSSLDSLTTVVPAEMSNGTGCEGEFTAEAGTSYALRLASLAMQEGGPYTFTWFKFPPANDDFVEAAQLSGTSGTLRDNNVGATKEQGEPNHDGEPGGASIWYTIYAPYAGTIHVDLAGSDFDTVVAAYTGSSVSALTPLAGGPEATGIDFAVADRSWYTIAVDGRSGATGHLVVNWTYAQGPRAPRPPNDDFASAQDVAGDAGAVTGTTAGATVETCDQFLDDGGIGVSVWYRWTAPASGAATFDTAGSAIDTILEVWDACPNSPSTLYAYNDDTGASTTTSRITFAAAGGATYFIRIDSRSEGSFALAWSLDRSPPPANDDFAAARPLAAQSGAVDAVNAGATKEVGEPSHAGDAGGHSVWFDWTAPASGTATFRTASDVDLVLAVYTGSSVSSLTQVAANDGWGGPTTDRVSFQATAGVTYHIAVDGKGGAEDASDDPFTLRWNGPPPPPNDAFANATPIGDDHGTVIESNAGATKEAGEPDHAGGPGGTSLWFRWTAPASGQAEFTTDDDRTEVDDTLLAVYTGSSLGSLTQVAAQDDQPSGWPLAYVIFNVTAGTTYWVAVDSKFEHIGRIALTWISTPTNDEFANTIPIAGANGSVSDSNEMGSKQAGEPNPGGIEGRATVWYRWTAPTSGTVTFDTCSSAWSYQVLGAYTGTTVTALTTVADSGPTFCLDHSQIWFTAAAGRTYSIALDNAYGATGPYTLAWRYSSTGPSPSNDMFANAEWLTDGMSTTDRGITVGATKEAGEPSHAGNPGGHSVWYRLNTNSAQQLTLDTRGSGFDTLLAVYTGPQVATVSTLTPLVSNDDAAAGTTTSQVSFATAANGTYYIAVDGKNGEVGSLHLNLSFAPLPPPPPNDNFAAAQAISGWNGSARGTTVSATKQPGEPNHAGNTGGHSVWYRWTAPGNGYVSFDTAGSGFDTLLAVYRGSGLSSLSQEAANDDAGAGTTTSRVRFRAKSGTTYWIAVDGKNAASGAVALAWVAG